MSIFALLFLSLLFTMPVAFAEEDANAYFVLMEKVADAQEELVTLENLIKSNGLNMGEGLSDFASELEMVVELAGEPETLEDAQTILDGSEEILDDIYTQLEAQIDSRQNERFEQFVDEAKTSINFILENAETLGISQAVYNELETTLTILENGNSEEILDATSEESNLGLTASLFPDDHPGFGKASDNNQGQGKGIGIGEIPPGLEKLPPGIKAKYDISTDSNLDSQISDVSGEVNGNGQTNRNDNSDFFESLPGYGAVYENGKSNGHGQGVGLGVGPEAPGIMNKDIEWLYDHGIILDDTWEYDFEDDDFSQGKGQGKGKGKGPPEGKGKACQGGACAQGGGQGQGSGQGQSGEPPGQSGDPPGQSGEPPGQSGETPGKGGGPPPGKNKNKP